MQNGGFIVTSYFTVGTPYADICHKYLMPSVRRLQLHSDVRAIASRGSWTRNTAYKPEFLRMMLDNHEENIVFVDVDAEIRFYPGEFLNIPEEYCIAAHTLDKSAWYGGNYQQGRYELLSGTLWIRNCDESRKILDAWNTACRATSIWEQKVLQSVLEQLGVKSYQLPLSYCYIKTLPGDREPLVKVDVPIIVHHQVSRKLRKAIC